MEAQGSAEVCTGHLLQARLGLSDKAGTRPQRAFTPLHSTPRPSEPSPSRVSWAVLLVLRDTSVGQSSLETSPGGSEKPTHTQSSFSEQKWETTRGTGSGKGRSKEAKWKEGAGWLQDTNIVYTLCPFCPLPALSLTAFLPPQL